MELLINKDKKQDASKQITLDNRYTKTLRLMSHIILAMGVFVAIFYFIFNLIVPALNKGVIHTILNTLIMLIPFIFATSLIEAYIHKVKNRFDMTRTNEILQFSVREIRYSYRNKHTLPCERQIIIINPKDIDKVSYNNDTKKISITGKIKSEYYENYVDVPNETAIVETFEVYDYFEPSLKEQLFSLK